MHETEIPSTQWQPFCERFTRQHRGWLIGMHQLPTRTLHAGTPAAPEAALFEGVRPLQEVRKGRRGDACEVMVTVGEGQSEISFLVEDVIALFSRSSGAAHQGLRLDSRNGMSTLIRFRSAAEPETLDGLAAGEI